MTDGRGRVAVIRDPAIAAAVGKCWLSRTQNKGLSAFHPEECGFCEMPLETLMVALQEFGIWSGLAWRQEHFDPSNPTMFPWKQEIENFMRLPAADQLERVQRAQGYLDGDDD